MTSTAFYQTVVWNTADKFLRSIVEPEDYGDYILPLTVLRRLECILEPTKDEVLDLVSQLQSEGNSDAMIDWQVRQKFDLSFYNSSRLDLTRIAQLDDHVYESLMEYVGSFSSSIRDIWDAFDFDVRMKTLDSASRLWQAVKHFAGIDMSIEALPDTQMGDLFEHIMYKSFDTKGKAAGAFYTPRDAIRLMVDILFASDDVGLTEDGASRAVYDPCVGYASSIKASGAPLGTGSLRNRPYVQTSIRSPSTRNFPRSVPSRTNPAALAICPEAGLFTRCPSSRRSRPRAFSAHCATATAARLVQPRPRADFVIQYQNQPLRLVSSTVTHTSPTSTSRSAIAHASCGESAAMSRSM